MTRFEFTAQLRKALSGRINHAAVNENVTYYENYIDTEIRKGRREQEVLEELGDPRLIAKTIIDTAKEEDWATSETAEEEKKGNFFTGKSIRLPVWIFVIVLLLLAVLILHIVGAVLAFLLPIAIPVALVWLLIRFFRRS